MTSRRRRTAAYLACAMAWGGAALDRLGQRPGSTAAERLAPLPGDELVQHPSLVTNHAILIDAAPDQVWPWLTQMGWHRAGWYTPQWVDRLLVPGNWASADVLQSGLVRDLRPGDTIPDGPPGTAWFVVERVEPPYLLVLHSTSHLPPGWRERYGAQLDWSWTFRLTGAESDRAGGGEGRTRLLVRSRGLVRPGWLDIGYRALIVPADHVMATGMLRGVKRRVEQASPRRRDEGPSPVGHGPMTMGGTGHSPGHNRPGTPRSTPCRRQGPTDRSWQGSTSPRAAHPRWSTP